MNIYTKTLNHIAELETNLGFAFPDSYKTDLINQTLPNPNQYTGETQCFYLYNCESKVARCYYISQMYEFAAITTIMGLPYLAIGRTACGGQLMLELAESSARIFMSGSAVAGTEVVYVAESYDEFITGLTGSEFAPDRIEGKYIPNIEAIAPQDQLTYLKDCADVMIIHNTGLADLNIKFDFFSSEVSRLENKLTHAGTELEEEGNREKLALRLAETKDLLKVTQQQLESHNKEARQLEKVIVMVTTLLPAEPFNI